jgi:hypothetical protein
MTKEIRGEGGAESPPVSPENGPIGGATHDHPGQIADTKQTPDAPVSFDPNSTQGRMEDGKVSSFTEDKVGYLSGKDTPNGGLNFDRSDPLVGLHRVESFVRNERPGHDNAHHNQNIDCKLRAQEDYYGCFSLNDD